MAINYGYSFQIKLYENKLEIFLKKYKNYATNKIKIYKKGINYLY